MKTPGATPSHVDGQCGNGSGHAKRCESKPNNPEGTSFCQTSASAIKTSSTNTSYCLAERGSLGAVMHDRDMM